MSLPVESVEARLARLEAPVKYEFCRLESERWAYVDALWESGDAPLDAVEPHITQRKSKNALKKVRLHRKTEQEHSLLSNRYTLYITTTLLS